jgi:putative phosphoribosyl transferase
VPTLLIVGGIDVPVIGLNHKALDQIGTLEKQLVIVPGASHLFEEPGTLEEMARLAAAWFGRYLRPVAGPATGHEARPTPTAL